jgi:predicted dehydrogenase
MAKYSAVQIGLGSRGRIQLRAFLENPDYFEVVGICDIIPASVEEAGKQYYIDESRLYTNAETMLSELRPDIMAFATMPDVRVELVELAVKYGVKGLMFEKPMATTLEDARYITDLCNKNGIKAVVCHQHKYLGSFLKLREFIDSGELGEIYQIDAACQAHASQLGTHYIDYILWANNNHKALSVVGHVHGNFFLEDHHPSPDFVLGEIIFENGVRSYFDCGYFSKPKTKHNVGFTYKVTEHQYWTDDRLTVYGTTGYAWAECNGRWAAFTSRTGGQVISGSVQDFSDEQYPAQARYTRDFALWMEDDSKVHSSNINTAYHGYEILESMYMSALERTRMDLPITFPLKYDALTELKKNLAPVTYRKFE